MENSEPQPTDPMRQLKDAKFALNSGSAKKAYETALGALQAARAHDIPLIEAYALHRIGSAQEALGLYREAERHMGLSLTLLESLDEPDYLAQGIVERDIALLIAQHDKSSGGRSEAHEWHERALTSHEMASDQPSGKPLRTKLELATTAAFGNRLSVLENRYNHKMLWDDVRKIRDLRRHTKPAYELDALDWATRYEHNPTTIVRALPRAAFLSLQVGNPVTPIRMYSRPGTRFASNLLEEL